MMPGTAHYAPIGITPPFVIHGISEDQTVFGPIAQSGQWEPHLVAALREIIQPDFVCLDIGANIGAITLVLSRLAFRGAVHAFEPSAATAELLRRNVETNGITNVTVVERAVASRSGETVELYTIPDQLGTAHLTAHLGRDGDIQRVTTCAIDDYALPRLDFIKLDVEGAEIAALEGARRVIAHYRPVLVVEYNPAPAAWFAQASKRALYDVLVGMYSTISIILPDGSLQPVHDWAVLDTALPEGAWCDLLCR